ncbi:ubiquinone anaerobic biosynthesis accessory factor UbiT [Rhodobacter lacus]|uniref:SCP2 domain-containing protein n=1 Tax=Rhodobacter lacus TaxID=1641972 RepID=A0ABW5AA60_9RHOB
MSDHDQIPRLPRLMGRAMRPLPLAPLSVTLTLLARRIAKRHPGLFQRLGQYREARFLLEATDLPFLLLLDLRGGKVKLTAHRRAPEAEARIAGPIAGFLGMMHGAYDGDALFFSRDLIVEGDTSAVVALRNAIDDAELDLAAELAELAGPLKPFVQPAVNLAEKGSGLVLHRVDTLAGGWT